MSQVRQGLDDPRVGLGLIRPAGKLGQPRAGGATRGIEVADDHVIEQDVVQAPRRQLAADEVSMDVQDRHVRQRGLQIGRHRHAPFTAEAATKSLHR